MERISGHEAVDVLYNIGGRLPLTGTGVGRVLLAHAEPDFQEHILAQADTNPESLRRTLANIRRDAVPLFRPGPPWPVVSVAAPVFGEGGIAAAVSIIVPEPTTQDPRRLIAAVRMAGRGISRALVPR